MQCTTLNRYCIPGCHTSSQLRNVGFLYYAGFHLCICKNLYTALCIMKINEEEFMFMLVSGQFTLFPINISVIQQRFIQVE